MSNIMSGKRIWELDFIRGAAVLGMIFDHINYVLIVYHNTFMLSGVAFDITEILMSYGGKIFILISGICCCYSKNNLKRGLKLFFVAMVVTYVTVIYQYMLDNSTAISTIFFGILHFLALSMMAGHYLLKIPQKKYITNTFYLILGIVIIIAGIILESYNINFPVICGNIIKPWFLSADYFPLIPNIGWFILGIFIGKTFYSRGHVLFKSEKAGDFVIIKGISFIGKHSLIFYLAHQPVIFGIIFILQSTGLLN